MSKEGPPALLYPLAQRVKRILHVDCEGNRMPQLHWYGECFGEQKSIEKAYMYPECDMRTVKLYFFALLWELQWCARHLPEMGMMDRDRYETVKQRCENMLQEARLTQQEKRIYWETIAE